MKVIIVKKGTSNAKPSNYCDFMIDVPPMQKK